jgi:hypothetical protein
LSEIRQTQQNSQGKRMWIVAVAWIYVVALMAATEPTIVHGVMTFVFYCALPLSIVFYLTGSKRRRARREAQASGAKTGSAGAAGADSVPATAGGKHCAADDGCDGGGDGGGGGD